MKIDHYIVDRPSDRDLILTFIGIFSAREKLVKDDAAEITRKIRSIADYYPDNNKCLNLNDCSRNPMLSK